jgi:hypothetical protein
MWNYLFKNLVPDQRDVFSPAQICSTKRSTNTKHCCTKSMVRYPVDTLLCCVFRMSSKLLAHKYITYRYSYVHRYRYTYIRLKKLYTIVRPSDLSFWLYDDLMVPVPRRVEGWGYCGLSVIIKVVNNPIPIFLTSLHTTTSLCMD